MDKKNRKGKQKFLKINMLCNSERECNFHSFILIMDIIFVKVINIQ